MFQYNRITHHIDLYLKGLHLQAGRTYELSMDIYGGPISIFISRYGITKHAGEHRIGYNADWTHYVFPFSTAIDSPDLDNFSEWGISLIKKADDCDPAEAGDTYIDNVQLVCADEPGTSLIKGGNFEAPKNSPVYSSNWEQEFFGISGSTYGVGIVTDPLNRSNHCLRLPRLLRQIEDLALPIRVSSFGYFKNSEQNVSSSKFALPAKHAFILVVHGTAEIQTPDNAFTACDSQLVYLPPSTEAKIVFSSGQNTAYYQLNLYIVSGNTMLNRLNIPPASSITLADITTLCSHVDTMLHYPTQSESYLYAINGQLFQFLAELERQLTTPHVEKERYAFITSLAKQLRENPESPLDITEEAHKCGLSKCYFITLFKQHTGLAPQQYRLRELINKACVLLQNTTMTIQEITYALGLDDPQYFSRLFRSIRGISPRDYRKRHLL